MNGDTNISHQQKAELLRLRLRVAMYKVETNQINVPLSRLQLRSSPTISQPDTPVHASPPTRSVPGRDSSPNPSVVSQLLGSPVKLANTASTRHVRGMRGQGLGLSAAFNHTDAPKLLPGPVLKPTAYSSRFIAAPLEAGREATLEASPTRPRSASADSSESKTEIASSASVSSQTENQNVDPEIGQSLLTDPTEHSSSKLGDDAHMTNGEDTAANGLLELMHAGASAAAL